VVKWVPLKAETVAEAQEKFRKLLVQRSDDELPHIGRCPTFNVYVQETYLSRLATSVKKPDTLVTEKVHLKQLRKSIGHLYLDKIRPYHVANHLQKLKELGKANRACNRAMVVLRNVLKNAKVDAFIKTLPVDGIAWQTRRARQDFSRIPTADASGVGLDLPGLQEGHVWQRRPQSLSALPGSAA